MDTYLSMRVFREVVEAGSFVTASDRLGISTPMTSKHVAHLERHLGARLLNRTSRYLSLTEAGTLYYQQCREALDTLQAAEAAIGHSAEVPQGTLKVTAPVWCGCRRFTEALAAYCERYPQVMLDMRLENRRVDLAEEGIDLALRMTSDPSPTLIVRPVCPVPFHLVASPAYIAKQGTVDTPADLSRHRLILPSYVSMERLTLEGPDGRVEVRLTATMKSNDNTFSYHAVHAGIGMSFMPGWLVDDDLRDGRLVEPLPAYRLPTGTLFAAYTSRKYLAPKVRSFIDFLTGALGE